MPRPPKRKGSTPTVGTSIRHQYTAPDILTGDVWKVSFGLKEPEVPILLDRGTFEWLWDFVARKGRQADADNFPYSDIHKDVYQRAADQFALAAQTAFGETYKVQDAKKATKKVAEEPAEAPQSPPKRRRRRKPTETTQEKMQASEALLKTSKARRRRKPRSEA